MFSAAAPGLVSASLGRVLKVGDEGTAPALALDGDHTRPFEQPQTALDLPAAQAGALKRFGRQPDRVAPSVVKNEPIYLD